MLAGLTEPAQVDDSLQAGGGGRFSKRPGQDPITLAILAPGGHHRVNQVVRKSASAQRTDEFLAVCRGRSATTLDLRVAAQRA
jgi:hypothetical protein